MAFVIGDKTYTEHPMLDEICYKRLTDSLDCARNLHVLLMIAILANPEFYSPVMLDIDPVLMCFWIAVVKALRVSVTASSPGNSIVKLMMDVMTNAST